MRDYVISSIDEAYEFTKFDTALAIMECYIKQLDMQIYFEGATTATEAPPVQQPAAEPQQAASPDPAAQPQPQAQAQATDQSQQQMSGNMNINPNSLIQVLMKLIETLVAATEKFAQATATQVAIQQTIKQENEIDQTIDQAIQQGTIDPNDDNLVNEILAPEEGEEPDPEDSKPEVVERKKKLVKCVLVGDFTGAGIFSPDSMSALQQGVEILNGLVSESKHMRGKDPNAVCQEITAQLKKNNEALAALHGNNARTQVDKFGTTQKMSKKSFREAEQQATKMIAKMSSQLKTIEQMFKQGGFWNALGNAFTKDLGAKTIATDAYKELKKTLSVIRNTMSYVMSDIKLVRKVNRKMLKKLNVIIVNGNNGVQAYANRKGVAKQGITTQMLERKDKKRVSTFDGNGYMDASAAYNAAPAV